MTVDDQPFDPLIDLDGLWTPELAEHYLPIEGAPPARYEAVNGKLIMSPREGSANSWASAVLREPVRRMTWVPADKVLMPVEFVSPSSRRRDRIDKPTLAAAAGIPYYLRVEISDESTSPEIHLFQLFDETYKLIESAYAEQQFHMKHPFEVAFYPEELLEP